jgi:hypothetical protein
VGKGKIMSLSLKYNIYIKEIIREGARERIIEKISNKVQKKKKIETEKYRCQMEENITLRTNKY